MKIYPIILATFILKANLAIGQLEFLEKYRNHPTYTEVVEKFSNEYNLQTTKNTQYKLIHNPKGWSISLYDPHEQKDIDIEQYWDGKKYLKLQNTKTLTDTDDNASEKQKLLSRLNILEYSRHPYFGYGSWTDDVISNFEQIADQLNVIEAYGLGRSYSIKLSNYSTNPYNYKLNSVIQFKEGGNLLSQDQIDTFLFFNKKAIQHFKLAQSLNPKLCVIVGNIDTKICNEYVDLFFNPTCRQNRKPRLISGL